MRNILLILLILFSTPANATLVSTPTTWSNGDVVTASKLNGNQTAITSVVNGGLDNTNVNTTGGYRLYEVLSALPTAGSQGRTVFNTANNTLNVDTGSAFVATVTPSGTLATGKIPYYNSGWQLLTPGSANLALVSNGATSLPSYQAVSLSAGVTGTLPIANGGSGQTTAALAINALLPSQTSNSGKLLTTNGSVASWGNGGLQLTSTTPVTAAANTGDIAITNTKYYKVKFQLNSFSGNDFLLLRFNNSSASVYEYMYNGRTSGGAITGGGAGATAIALHTTAAGGGDFHIVGDLNIYPQKSSNIILVNGTMTYTDSAGAMLTSVDFGGYFSSTAVTSFRLLTSGSATFSGNVYLYEFSQ